MWNEHTHISTLEYWRHRGADLFGFLINPPLSLYYSGPTSNGTSGSLFFVRGLAV